MTKRVTASLRGGVQGSDVLAFLEMCMFHTRALYDPGPDTLVALGDTVSLFVPANVLEFVVVVVVVSPVPDVRIGDLGLLTRYGWNTLMKGDQHD